MTQGLAIDLCGEIAYDLRMADHHRKFSQRMELVVARYQEDLQWLRRVPKRFQIKVYNKGGALNLPARRALSSVALPNIGREDYAYLSHIVTNYETLADVTVFAQGKPFDHVPEFHRVLHGIAFQKLRIADFQWFGFIIDEDDCYGNRLFRSWSKNPGAESLPMRAFWHHLWDVPSPDRFVFYPSAHFAVPAVQVRPQPRAFYERALSLCVQHPHHAHCFERVWDRIFAVNGIPARWQKHPKPIYFRATRRQTQSSSR